MWVTLVQTSVRGVSIEWPPTKYLLLINMFYTIISILQQRYDCPEHAGGRCLNINKNFGCYSLNGINLDLWHEKQQNRITQLQHDIFKSFLLPLYETVVLLRW